MTLGEYPDKVDPRFRLDLDRFFHSEFDIGRFRDVSHLVGLGDRINQSGGAIMDDFDNDGLLDIVMTCSRPDAEHGLLPQRGRRRRSRIGPRRPGSPTSSAAWSATRPTTTTTAGWTSSSRAAPGTSGRCGRRLLHNRGGGRFSDVTRTGRAARPGQFQRRGLGRLRQRRLGRPVRRLRAPGQPPVPQSRATAPSRRSPPGPACRATRSGSPRAAPGSTTTTTASPTCSSTTSSTTPGSTTTSATAASIEVTTPHGHRRPQGLLLLVVRLRQRRLARHLRRLLRPPDRRGASGACWGCPWSGPATGCTATCRARGSRT